MATINVYSPLNEIAPDGNSRARVNYERDSGRVSIGVEHAIRDRHPAEDLPIYDAANGMWSELDRRGCNDLIRAVREARDKAFGRDE